MSQRDLATDLNILGLIPARGGSKSIPLKNIAPLLGQPLLAYTCQAALGSRYLNRVVLSTDNDEIARVGIQFGVEVPFMRPAELARDDTPSLPVVQHAVRWLEQRDDWRPDVIVLLQPTSPLRRSQHIDEALELLFQSGADTAVSVVEVPHRFSPYSIMQLEGGWLRPFWQQDLPFDRFHRQSHPKFYARNGPAVLAVLYHVVMVQNRLYGDRIAPYIMHEEDSFDIDELADLQRAATILSRRQQ